MEEEIKPRFGGIPFRALRDGELTLLDIRLLAVIAAHDGFNKNRRGCFASHKRLASLIEAHYKSAARSIAKLIDRGYVDASQQGDDGRLRVYRVIYTQEDHHAFRGDGRSHAPARQLKSVTHTVTNHETKSVTHETTDTPAKDSQPLAGVGNSPSSGSVTESEEIGNRNEPQRDANSLISRDETNRINSTESKWNKKIIDHAEAGLVNGAQEDGAPPRTERAECAAMLLGVISQATRKQKPRCGPATDGDAEIDLAIRRQASDASPVDFERERALRSSARPSADLLNTTASRAARGVA